MIKDKLINGILNSKNINQCLIIKYLISNKRLLDQLSLLY
jgi:hypothetical protein